MVQPWVWPAFATNLPVVAINGFFLESIEALSAFFFLKYHPALKDVRDWKGIVAFGLGFGCGEAITLGVIFFSSISIPYSLDFVVGEVIFGAFVGRIFATIGTHLCSACFLGFFLISRKKRDLILGVLSKSLAASMGIVLFIAKDFELLVGALALVLFIYPAFWISVVLYLKKKEGIVDEMSRKPFRMNRVNILIPGIILFLFFFVWSRIIEPALNLPLILTVFSEVGLFFALTIVLYPILKKMRNATSTEIAVAGAASLALAVGVQNLIFGMESLDLSISLSYQLPVFLLIATIPFLGVICAIGVYRVLIRKRLEK